MNIDQELRRAAHGARDAYTPNLSTVEELVAGAIRNRTATKDLIMDIEHGIVTDTTHTAAWRQRPRPRRRLIAAVAGAAAIGTGIVAFAPGTGSPALAYDTTDASYIYRTTTSIDDEAVANGVRYPGRVRYQVRTEGDRQVVVGSVTIDDAGNPIDGIEFVDDNAIRIWTGGESKGQEIVEPGVVPEDAATSGAASLAFEDWAWVEPFGPFAGAIPDGLEVGDSFDSSPTPPADLDIAIGLPECTTTLTARNGDEYSFHTECTTPGVNGDSVGLPGAPATTGDDHADESADPTEDSGKVAAQDPGADAVEIPDDLECIDRGSSTTSDITIDAGLGVVIESTSTIAGGELDCNHDEFDLPVKSVTTHSVLERT